MKILLLSFCGLIALLTGIIVPFHMSSADDVKSTPQLVPAIITSNSGPTTVINPSTPIIASPVPTDSATSTLPTPTSTTEISKISNMSIVGGVAGNVELSNAVSKPDNRDSITMIKSKPYEQITSGSFTVMNNLWGAPKNEAVSSNIFQAPDGSFGWDWSRLSPVIYSGQSSIQPIYPSIRIGGNRWERTKTADFPVAIKDVNTLNFDIAYNYPVIPKGSFDLSYDMFLSDPNQPDSSPQIAAEVMIWLQGTSKQPDKYCKGDVSDGTNTFTLYSWTMSDGRQYYSFLLKGQPQYQAQYSINARALLDQLKLDSNLLIHGVEFGNEVWNGSGQIQITHFVININGHEL